MAITSTFLRNASLGLSLSLAACSKPDPPQITVKEARIIGLDANGVTVQVRVDATNPNAVALSVQSVTGNVKLDGKHDLGTITVPKPVSLPAKATTPLDVPLVAKWQSLATLTQLAAAQRTIPFTVDGTVAVGGESLSINVPFQTSGSVTREQLTEAAIRSIPQIPGLNLLPPSP